MIKPIEIKIHQILVNEANIHQDVHHLDFTITGEVQTENGEEELQQFLFVMEQRLNERGDIRAHVSVAV